MIYNYNNTVLKICVQEYTDGHIKGQLRGPLVEEPVKFSDAGYMLLQIDEVLNQIGHPRAFNKLRSFFPEPAPVRSPFAPPEHKIPVYEDDTRDCDHVFFLRVTSRQSASWQGSMEYNGARYPFKSALQFLKDIFTILEGQAELDNEGQEVV